MSKTCKVIIFSAPSGSGKSTLIHYLMEHVRQLTFSRSATSRPPRAGEQDGVDYYFLSPEAFRAGIAAGDFVEWEEVYPDRFYGTLKREVERIDGEGGIPVFDIDVKGAMNLKAYYGEQALSLFIEPPSLEVLAERLKARGTETAESLRERLKRAQFELSYAPRFDVRIVNDDLKQAQADVLKAVEQFLNKA